VELQLQKVKRRNLAHLDGYDNAVHASWPCRTAQQAVAAVLDATEAEDTHEDVQGRRGLTALLPWNATAHKRG